MTRVGRRLRDAGYALADARHRRFEALLARHGGERREVGRSALGEAIVSYSFHIGPLDALAPSITLLSLLHPMEWIGFEAHHALVAALLERRSALALPRSYRIESLPVANPDGVARVEQGLSSGRWPWIRGNARGVDLNRNFAVDHRARPGWLRFWPLYRPGPFPLSEPETVAVGSWVPRGGTSLSLSLHSFGRWIFYPPSARREEGTHAAAHRALLLEAFRHAEGSGYRHAQLGRWTRWFSAPGAEIDFLSGVTGSPAFLIEISGGGIGRWGLASAAVPLLAFNPPDRDRELSRVLPLLTALAALGLSRQYPPGPAEGARVSPD